MSHIENIIKKLDLNPHPEGGYFKESYRSKGFIQQESLLTDYQGNRNYSTCIYFLLTAEVFSAFHRIKQDEIWHFYDGSPLELHIISPEGKYSLIEIGSDIENGQIPQFVVLGGSWFAANVKRNGEYTLLGCTVAPGFDFQDFELATRNELIKQFPSHSEIITQLTR